MKLFRDLHKQSWQKEMERGKPIIIAQLGHDTTGFTPSMFNTAKQYAQEYGYIIKHIAQLKHPNLFSPLDILYTNDLLQFSNDGIRRKGYMVETFMKFPDRTISTMEGIESFFKEEEKKMLELKEANELLARSFGVILFFNSLSDKQKASILDRLLRYLKELKKKLDAIAKDWGVSDYTIGVSFTGVNLSLTFEPKEVE